jgi:hypothetical protein
MLTAWCLAVAFVTPWVVGAPVLWLTRGLRPARGRDWLLAPFLGLAVLVCVLQSLVVFADLPLARTAPWFWAAVAGGWVAMLAARRGRASLRTLPARALAVSLAVFLTQGTAVLVGGIGDYRGHFYSDQFNYVLVATHLTEVPLSTPMSEAPGRPWLILPIGLSVDRLGQSVIHGFLALTAGRDALDLFFPTALLGPALVAPAVMLVAPYLGLFRWRAARAAFAAGVVPGVTAVFVDCYLSQLLFVPVLYASLGVALRALRRPRELVGVALLGSLGFAVYTEFEPFLAAVAAVVAGSAWVLGRIRATRAGAVLAVAALAPLLNPAAVQAAAAIFDRSQHLGTQIDFPHSSAFVVARQWLDTHRAAVLGSPARRPIPVVVVLGLTAVSLGAWAVRAGGARRRGAPAYCAAVALLLIPVGGWAVKPDARYAIYKACCTVAPLLAIGLELAAPRRGTSYGTGLGAAWRRARWAVPAVAVPALVYFTVVCQLQTIRVVSIQTTTARAWSDPAVQDVCRYIRAQHPGDLIVDLGNGEDSWVAAWAFAYTGRHHRVWLASPNKVWIYGGLPFPPGPPDDAPPGADGPLVVVRRDAPARGTPVHENDVYRVFRRDPAPKLP